MKPIRTEEDYEAALTELKPLFDAKPEPGTDDFDRFEILAMLVDAYENDQYPIAMPDPVDAIAFHMEQHGFSAQVLADVIGSKARASELLNRKTSTLALADPNHPCGMGDPRRYTGSRASKRNGCMMLSNFTRMTPNGNPTDREKAIDALYDALKGAVPAPFARGPRTEQQTELRELVADFWEGERGRSRPTAAMIRSVTRMIELTRGINAEARRES